MGLFTLGEARQQLASIKPLLDEFVALRADAAELGAAVAGSSAPSRLGGLPEFKAVQARMDQVLTEISATGVEFRGFAPLLVDFPAELDGQGVLLCWLEGDEELSWYHRHDLGFAGRRPLRPQPSPPDPLKSTRQEVHLDSPDSAVRVARKVRAGSPALGVELPRTS